MPSSLQAGSPLPIRQPHLCAPIAAAGAAAAPQGASLAAGTGPVGRHGRLAGLAAELGPLGAAKLQVSSAPSTPPALLPVLLVRQAANNLCAVYTDPNWRLESVAALRGTKEASITRNWAGGWSRALDTVMSGFVRFCLGCRPKQSATAMPATCRGTFNSQHLQAAVLHRARPA